MIKNLDVLKEFCAVHVKAYAENKEIKLSKKCYYKRNTS